MSSSSRGHPQIGWSKVWPRIVTQMCGASLLDELTEVSEGVGQFLEGFALARLAPGEEFTEHCLYPLRDIGLRARPYLFGVGCRFGRHSPSDFTGVAAGLEFMQAATLTLDDLMDAAAIRNGLPAVHAKWGMSEAILVAEVLKSLGASAIIETLAGTGQEAILPELLEFYEQTYREACAGQHLDLSFEERDHVTEAECFRMVSRTTGRFVQASLVAGALVSGVEGRVMDALGAYGEHLGVAYQLRDDIIDVLGEPELTGKPWATDLKTKKKRLPLLRMLSLCTPDEGAECRALLASTVDEEAANRLRELIVSTGSMESCMQETRRLCAQATAVLAPFPDSLPKQRLLELAELLCSFES